MKNKKLIVAPNILLPNQTINLTNFSVIACDQFTSQKHYWDDLKQFVGTSPSALNMIFPEAYLEQVDQGSYIKEINKNIKQYIKDNILIDIGKGFVLVERKTPFNEKRLGLVVSIDLEEYSFNIKKKALIRSTEETVVERIPPRLQIRKNAPIELSHVLLLFNDKNKSIIEKLYQNRQNLPLLYDFSLNQNGGHLKGYFVTETDSIVEQLFNLSNASIDNLLFLVGDGNHSLATAKTHWDKIKKKLNDEERNNHPARYSLVEIINLYDEGVKFEPIHRVVFNVNEDFIQGLKIAVQGSAETLIYSEHLGEQRFMIPSNTPMAYRLIQDYIDNYIKKNPEAYVDYVHDLQHTYAVANNSPTSVAIIMPRLSKNELFDFIIRGEVLPRKTFSMGFAVEKRYYLESKLIKLKETNNVRN